VTKDEAIDQLAECVVKLRNGSVGDPVAAKMYVPFDEVERVIKQIDETPK